MLEERQTPTDGMYQASDIKRVPLPDTFFGLLEAIRKRPAMYIGRQSFQDFTVWLDGYCFARMHAGVPLPDEGEFDGFNAFVSDKYRWHDSGGWAAKIAYFYRDDAIALDQFFKLLDEFRANK